MLCDTLRLMRVIGSPFIVHKPQNLANDKKKTKLLLRIADLNKVNLLFIESVMNFSKECSQLEFLLSTYRKNYELFQFSVMDIAGILNDSGIQYAVFKSLTSFPMSHSDVDILIFDDREFNGIHHFLKSQGFETIKVGPNSITVKNPRLDFKVDLHKEIAVSYLVYLDKNILRNFLHIQYLNSLPVVVFLEEFDMLISMCHSVYKEQLYTLADFYEILYTLSNLTTKQFTNFIDYTKTLKSDLAVSLSIACTAVLHKMAFNSIPSELIQLFSKLAPTTSHFVVNYEITKLLNSEDLPHKFSPISVTTAILAKLQYQRTRRNFHNQLRAFLKPSFIRDFSEQVWTHIKHDTY